MDRDRRSSLTSSRVGAVGAAAAPGGGKGRTACPAEGGLFPTHDFRPPFMLHIGQTRVPTPRFPMIYVQTYCSFTAAVDPPEAIGSRVCHENAVRLPEFSL